MKTMSLMITALLATASAQASTLTCSTEPTATGAQYVVALETDSASHTGNAHVTLHGGRAHFIMIIGDYPVELGHYGPEIGVFKNEEKQFELTVTYQRFGGRTTFPGTLKMLGLGGAALNEPVECR